MMKAWTLNVIFVHVINHKLSTMAWKNRAMQMASYEQVFR